MRLARCFPRVGWARGFDYYPIRVVLSHTVLRVWLTITRAHVVSHAKRLTVRESGEVDAPRSPRPRPPPPLQLGGPVAHDVLHDRDRAWVGFARAWPKAHARTDNEALVAARFATAAATAALNTAGDRVVQFKAQIERRRRRQVSLRRRSSRRCCRAAATTRTAMTRRASCAAAKADYRRQTERLWLCTAARHPALQRRAAAPAGGRLRRVASVRAAAASAY